MPTTTIERVTLLTAHFLFPFLWFGHTFRIDGNLPHFDSIDERAIGITVPCFGKYKGCFCSSCLEIHGQRLPGVRRRSYLLRVTFTYAEF